MGINTTTPRGTLDIVAPRVEEEGKLLDTTNHGIVVPSLKGRGCKFYASSEWDIGIY